MPRYAAGIAGVLIAAAALAQDSIEIHNGFVKGEQFLNMADPRQRAYQSVV